MLAPRTTPLTYKNSLQGAGKIFLSPHPSPCLDAPVIVLKRRTTKHYPVFNNNKCKCWGKQSAPITLEEALMEWTAQKASCLFLHLLKALKEKDIFSSRTTGLIQSTLQRQNSWTRRMRKFYGIFSPHSQPAPPEAFHSIILPPKLKLSQSISWKQRQENKSPPVDNLHPSLCHEEGPEGAWWSQRMEMWLLVKLSTINWERDFSSWPVSARTVPLVSIL